MTETTLTEVPRDREINLFVETEKLIATYSKRTEHVSPLLRSSMRTAYLQGINDTNKIVRAMAEQEADRLLEEKMILQATEIPEYSPEASSSPVTEATP